MHSSSYVLDDGAARKYYEAAEVLAGALYRQTSSSASEYRVAEAGRLYEECARAYRAAKQQRTPTIRDSTKHNQFKYSNTHEISLKVRA